METVEERLRDGVVEGILVLDSKLFASGALFHGETESGDMALWGLIACLHQVTSVLSSIANQVPFNYSEVGAVVDSGR